MNAAATTSQFPTFRKAGALLLRFIKACARRIQRLFLSRTSIKVYLITATLICLTYTSLRWVGRRALQAEKERVAALGMIADPALWPAPPPHPPDSENFFAAPIFAGIFQPPYPEAPHLRMWFSRNSYPVHDAHGRSKYKYFTAPKADTLAAWCEELRLFGELPDPPQQSTPAQELLTDHRWDATIKAPYAAAARPQARYPRDPVSFLGDPESVRMRADIIGPMMSSLHLYGRAQLKSGNTALAVPVLQITRHLIHAAEIEGYANARM